MLLKYFSYKPLIGEEFFKSYPGFEISATEKSKKIENIDFF